MEAASVAASHTAAAVMRVCCHTAASHTHLLTGGRWRPVLEQHLQSKEEPYESIYFVSATYKPVKNSLDAGTLFVNAAVLSRTI